MSRPKHIHRYERAALGKDGGYIVFKCNLPGCTHYLREELAKNKISICNRCGESFILTPAAMTLAKPHCIDCTKKRSNTFDNLKEFIEVNE